MDKALTVVVPVYGPGPHLESVVTALQRQSPPVGQIIVSHSGTGNPAARFAGWRNVAVLHSDERLFAGAARNRGLRQATTEWVAFIDEDAIPADGWHAAVQAAIARHDTDCILGAIDVAERGGYWGMSVWFAEFSSVHPYNPPRITTGGASANMIVRRKPFAALGGFPEQWRMAQDSLAQCRIRELGKELYFEPTIVVRHVNLPGLARMIRHLSEMGGWSARLRRACPNLPGAAMVIRWPLLSVGLWLARLGQLYFRALCGNGRLGALIVHTPGILIGLLAWNYGFFREALSPAQVSRALVQPGSKSGQAGHPAEAGRDQIDAEHERRAPI